MHFAWVPFCVGNGCVETHRVCVAFHLSPMMMKLCRFKNDMMEKMLDTWLTAEDVAKWRGEWWVHSPDGNGCDENGTPPAFQQDQHSPDVIDAPLKPAPKSNQANRRQSGSMPTCPKTATSRGDNSTVPTPSATPPKKRRTEVPTSASAASPQSGGSAAIVSLAKLEHKKLPVGMFVAGRHTHSVKCTSRTKSCEFKSPKGKSDSGEREWARPGQLVLCCSGVGRSYQEGASQPYYRTRKAFWFCTSKECLNSYEFPTFDYRKNSMPAWQWAVPKRVHGEYQTSEFQLPELLHVFPGTVLSAQERNQLVAVQKKTRKMSLCEVGWDSCWDTL